MNDGDASFVADAKNSTATKKKFHVMVIWIDLPSAAAIRTPLGVEQKVSKLFQQEWYFYMTGRPT